MATTRVFIDSRVNDKGRLISQFALGTEYQVLDANQDGIDQMVTALSGYSGYDSIQIISHGAPGSLTIGSTLLNNSTLELYATQLALMGSALTSAGDLLLYGSNVAAGEQGRQFIETLSQITGADVAASDDPTGGTAAGGDWVLEVQTGTVEPAAMVDAPEYGYLLTNSIPTVSGPLAITVTQGDSSLISLDLLANAHDDDLTDTLRVGTVTYTVDGVLFALSGITMNGNTLTINPSSSVYSAMVQGEQTTIVVSYQVLDSAAIAEMSFATKADYATGSYPSSVTSADVTGDSKPDLVVANYIGTVSVLVNNGDGTFATKADYPTGAGYYPRPYSVTSADVNDDGKFDLIVANYLSNTVSVLLNKGDGTFAKKVDYATGYNPDSVTSADVNCDGKPDLIVANSSSNTVSVLVNNSTSFTTYPTTTETITILGTNDAPVVTNSAKARQGFVIEAGYLLEGSATASGTLTASDPDTGATQTWSIADTTPASTYGSIEINANTGVWTYTLDNTKGATQALHEGETATESYTARVTDEFGAYADQTITVTIHGVSAPLAATVAEGDPSVSLDLLANAHDDEPTDTLRVGTVTYTVDGVPFALSGITMNGNTLTIDPSSPVYNTMGQGEQTTIVVSYQVLDRAAISELSFADKVAYATGSNPGQESVTSADVNGDGKLDLIVANVNSHTLSVLLNNGDGTFADKVDYADYAAGSPYSVTSADVNGDDKPDLIVANDSWSSGTVSVLINNGNGTFADKVDYTTGSSPRSVTSADLNGDGKLDLIVANAGSYTVSVLLNKGDGTFADKVDYTTGPSPYSVTSADVNGDGKPDLIVSKNGAVSVLLNKGDGTFADKLDYPTGTGSSVTSGDLDGDGKSDLIVANSYSNTVSVLINNSTSFTAYPTTTETITINGTNDAPVVTNSVAAKHGSVTEAGYRVDGLATASGKLTASDVDTGATLSWSIADTTPSSTYGSIAINANTGVWTYTLDDTKAATQALFDGETVTDSYTARVTDEFGAYADQTVTVTINGTSDDPLAPTFNINGYGKSVIDFGLCETGSSIVLQADKKILVAGSSCAGFKRDFALSDFALARFNADGRLDKTFSGDGILTTDFGSLDYCFGLTMQSDGKILAAGTSNSCFALARYNPDGTLDTSFSDDGKVTTNIPAYTTDILSYFYAYMSVAQVDGKILLAGGSNNHDFLLLRFNMDGTPDTTFSGDGKLTTDFNKGWDCANSLVVQPNGKILIAGFTSTDVQMLNFAVARYNQDGTPDTTFSDDGMLTTDFIGGYYSWSAAESVTIQPDDGKMKILVAGLAYYAGRYDFALARYNPDGTPDTSFDGDGKVTTGLPQRVSTHLCRA